MRPLLKYRGGKLREIPQFVDYIPQNFGTYIEPFVGGGALYFYLDHRPSIINDINTRLITFYTQLKEEFYEVKRQLHELQVLYEANQREYEEKKAAVGPDVRVENKNEELYYKLRDEFNYNSGKYLDAVLYYFINKTSYSGMIRYNKNGEYNVPFGRYKNFNTDIITVDHYELLKNTHIYNKDYTEIFAMANEDDFMFLDPPYDTTFHDYGNNGGGFGPEEHIRLARAFGELKCFALMVIGKTDLTTELYKDYYLVDEYEITYAVNIRNRFKNEAKHLIVTNYDPTKIPLRGKSSMVGQ